MAKPLRVLIVEDSEDDAALMARELRRGGYNPKCERVETAEAMRDALGRQDWDVILADYSLPHFSGTEALALMKDELELDLPFILVSGAIGEDTAVAAMRAGAHDYILKGNLTRLVPAVERELREAAGRRARRLVEEELRKHHEHLAELVEDRTAELQVQLTERERAEVALREKEEWFHSLVETAADAFFVMDSKGRFVEVNQSACDGVGYRREELLKLSAADIIVGWSPKMRAKTWGKVSLGKAVTFERSIRRKDGSIFPVEVSGCLVEFSGQRYAFGLCRDISERKQAAEKLLEETRKVAVVEERNRLAREIHDTLAQSLTGLYIRLEEAEELVDQDPVAARAQIQSARAATRDSLDEARRSVWDLQPLPLTCGNLTEAVQSELSKISDDGIHASLEVEGESPQPMNRRTELTALRVQQEALSNVRQHSGAKNVTVRLRYLPTRLHLQVVDDGVGFDPSATEGVLSSTGGGFGLTSMQQRARLAGGHIEVHSSPGIGTQIDLDLPYQAPAREAPLPAGTRTKSGRPQQGEAGAIKVLVVDDQEVARQGIRHMIEHADDLTVAGDATGGEGAIEQIQVLGPDVVVMDVRMPNLDGVETVKRLSDLGIDTPVILLSVYVEDEQIFEGLKAGARGYLTKDVGRDDLAQAIRTVHEGGSLLEPVIANRLIKRLDAEPTTDLTEREMEVLQLLATGARNKEIANQLTLSLNTVKFHVANMYQKLGTQTRTEAVRVATERGLLSV